MSQNLKESPSNLKPSSSLDSDMAPIKRVAFIGTGALCHAFIARAKKVQASTGLSAADARDLELVVGARQGSKFDIRGVQVLSVSEAIKSAFILVLCIPAKAYKGKSRKYIFLLII